MNTVTGVYRTRASGSSPSECVQSFSNSKSATNANLVVAVILIVIVVVMIIMRFFVAPTTYNAIGVSSPGASAGGTGGAGVVPQPAAATTMSHEKKAKYENGVIIASAVAAIINLGAAYWSRSAISQLGPCM